MSDTVKLIIEIPKATYEDLKSGKIYSSLCEAPQGLVEGIRNGTPLEEVLADLKEEIKEYSKKWLGLDYYDGIGSAIEAIDEYIEKESERNIDQENE